MQQIQTSSSELKIILTQACNAACVFCLQGKRTTPRPPFVSEERVLQWIDWAVSHHIDVIRFTGGEATLHPRLKFFCAYAFLNKRRVILNTHGFARLKLYQTLFPYLWKLSVSLPHFEAEHSDNLTGVPGGFKKKQAVILAALKAGVSVLLPTVLELELKGKLALFAEFAQRLPGTHWGALRYMPTPTNPRPWERGEAEDFTREIAELMRRYPETVCGIRNAVPFCAVKSTALARQVFAQRVDDCNANYQLTVDDKNVLRTCYISAPVSINGKRSMCSGENKNCNLIDALPDECQHCEFLQQCRGGCHSPTAVIDYKGKKIDYLAAFVNT